MSKYLITIEETCAQGFEIEAKDSEMAMEIAKNQYNNGELVLTPGEIQSKKMAVSALQNCVKEWIEF